ncbi:hypothetical protein [Tropicimonas sp.]|uniref:hypothetical protein n=1 Tax=Tropicimonas sp. TaxID=2067044 RepID=UPI003A885820
MTDTDTHRAIASDDKPHSGDRGWKGMQRSEGEGAFFAIVTVVLLIAILAGLALGLPAIGIIFVLLSFVALAALVLISVGQ